MKFICHILILICCSDVKWSVGSTSPLKLDFGINLPTMTFRLPSFNFPKLKVTAVIHRPNQPREPMKVTLPAISVNAQSLEPDNAGWSEGRDSSSDSGSNYNEHEHETDGGGGGDGGGSSSSGRGSDQYTDNGWSMESSGDETRVTEEPRSAIVQESELSNKPHVRSHSEQAKSVVRYSGGRPIGFMGNIQGYSPPLEASTPTVSQPSSSQSFSPNNQNNYLQQSNPRKSLLTDHQSPPPPPPQQQQLQPQQHYQVHHHHHQQPQHQHHHQQQQKQQQPQLLQPTIDSPNFSSSYSSTPPISESANDLILSDGSSQFDFAKKDFLPQSDDQLINQQPRQRSLPQQSTRFSFEQNDPFFALGESSMINKMTTSLTTGQSANQQMIKESGPVYTGSDSNSDQLNDNFRQNVADDSVNMEPLTDYQNSQQIVRQTLSPSYSGNMLRMNLGKA